MPAVKEDIKNDDIVIIKSRTFSNLMYQLSVKYDRDIHYDFLNEIITHNLGTDISPIIDSFICDKLSNAVNSSFLQN